MNAKWRGHKIRLSSLKFEAKVEDNTHLCDSMRRVDVVITHPNAILQFGILTAFNGQMISR